MPINGRDNKMVRSSNYIGNISRTALPRRFPFRSTFSAGKLFPIYADEIYPGMQKRIDVGALIRSITPLGPVMDNSFFDIFFFFVPSRLLWDHFEEFIAGYNKEAWTQGVEYKKPKIIFQASAAKTADDVNEFLHSFLDYLPGGCDVCSLHAVMDYINASSDTSEKTVITKRMNDTYWIDALYPRAMVKIWNDWFRDENLQDELELYTGDSNEYADEFAFDLLHSSGLPSAAKYHNRYTSALPAPLKGPDVLIPMTGLKVGSFDNAGDNFVQNIMQGVVSEGDDYVVSGLLGGSGSDAETHMDQPVFANNVSNTIRMLRIATQTEKLLARDARGGTRFCESILSHFAVHNGDARLQRSEYLGSVQVPLQVQQVTNTAQGEGSALGNVGGQSVTKFNNHIVNAAFSEWGILFGFGVVRTNISYSSGVRKIYQREGRFDHIWPEFKHIGDVALKTRELSTEFSFIFRENFDADTVFGYTPYASERREGYNYNNGLFRGQAKGNLSYLTYQEVYPTDDIPVLSADWIKQPEKVVSNTLVDQEGPQYYALFDIQEVSIEPIDPTSDPGLMDHF